MWLRLTRQSAPTRDYTNHRRSLRWLSATSVQNASWGLKGNAQKTSSQSTSPSFPSILSDSSDARATKRERNSLRRKGELAKNGIELPASPLPVAADRRLRTPERSLFGSLSDSVRLPVQNDVQQTSQLPDEHTSPEPSSSPPPGQPPASQRLQARPETNPAVLAVSNLPSTCDGDLLRETFERFVRVEEVKIAEGRNAMPTSEAKIYLEPQSDVQLLIEMFEDAPIILGGRRLKVTPFVETASEAVIKRKPEIRHEVEPGSNLPSSIDDVLYASNLPHDPGEPKLQTTMSAMDPVKEVANTRSHEPESAAHGSVRFQDPERQHKSPVLRGPHFKVARVDESGNDLDDHRQSSHNPQFTTNILHVSNYPYKASEDELSHLFSEIAPVQAVVHGRGSSGQPTGYGHILFSSIADAQKVLDAHRASPFELYSRPLRIDLARKVPKELVGMVHYSLGRTPSPSAAPADGTNVFDREPDKNTSMNDPDAIASSQHDISRVYVSNIPSDVDRLRLENFFQESGVPILDVTPIRTFTTKWSAHVLMKPEDAQSLLRAVQIQPLWIGNRHLHIVQAQPSTSYSIKAPGNELQQDTLGVAGLPEELLREDILRTEFQRMAPVQDVKIDPRSADPALRIQATISFQNSHDVGKILQVHEIIPMTIQGHPIRLSLVQAKPPLRHISQLLRAGDDILQSKTALFVDRIPWDVDDVDLLLIEEIEKYAPVKKVTMGRSIRGVAGGFARVDFADASHAQAVLDAHFVDPLSIFDKPLYVKRAHAAAHAHGVFSEYVKPWDAVARQTLHVLVKGLEGKSEIVEESLSRFGRVESVLSDFHDPSLYTVRFVDRDVAEQIMQRHLEQPLCIEEFGVELHYVLELDQTWDECHEDAIPSRSLYIINLDQNVRYPELLDEISWALGRSLACGSEEAKRRIARVNIGESGSSKAGANMTFAHVDFRHVADAHRVRQAHHATPFVFNGRCCEMVYNNKKRENLPLDMRSGPDRRVLTLHGLPPRITKEDIQAEARKFGPVAWAAIGAGGLAHVSFTSSKAAFAMKTAVDASAQDGHGFVLAGEPVSLVAFFSGIMSDPAQHKEAERRASAQAHTLDRHRRSSRSDRS